MKQKQTFRPANLRSLLVVLLSVIILGGSALFYVNLTAIREYASEVNQTIADANASSKQLQGLQTLKNQLSQSTALIDKANQLFTTPDAYQSQALNDIKRYADAAGIAITSTTFSDSGHSVTVALKNPVAYTRLITFLANIESNLPKLQVSALSLDPPDNGSPSSVKVNDIKIDISVR